MLYVTSLMEADYRYRTHHIPKRVSESFLIRTCVLYGMVTLHCGPTPRVPPLSTVYLLHPR